MANPVSRNRKPAWGVMLTLWAAGSFIVFFGGIPWLGIFYPVILDLGDTLRIGIFSTLIAAGIPALYQIHTTWVKQPEITTDLGYSKTFLRNGIARCDNCNWQAPPPFYRDIVQEQNLALGQCPSCSKHTIVQKTQVIPTLFAHLTIQNVGEATARNSFVTFNAPPDERWYGRWAVPENPEKFDLHPKDQRDIHIFRTYINFYGEVEEERDGETYVLAPQSEFSILTNDVPDFEAEIFEIRSQYPETERPEEQGESSHAGWRGHRLQIPVSDNYQVTFSYSAEDWHSDDRTETIQLDTQLMDEDLWQTAWSDRLPDIVEYIETQLNAELT